MVLVLDAISSSTRTSTANAEYEYEYEKIGIVRIETHRHSPKAQLQKALACLTLQGVECLEGSSNHAWGIKVVHTTGVFERAFVFAAGLAR